MPPIDQLYSVATVGKILLPKPSARVRADFSTADVV